MPAAVTLITNKDWTALKDGWVYKVVLPDHSVVFWFSETRLNLRARMLSEEIREFNGSDISVGQPLTEEWQKFFKADEPEQ